MPQTRHRLIALSAAGLMLSVVSSAGLAQTVPLNGWRQTFADEFERATLDTARWNIANYAAPNNGEAQYYSPSNVSILNGGLRLLSERRNIGGRQYASGNVTTQGKFAQAYGRFEMLAKLPGTQGIWPAFWMLRDSGGWPPEIDIMELLGHQPNIMYFTNHWGTYPGVIVDSKSFAGPDFTAGYHTFAVEWSPGRIELYIDGVKRLTNTNSGIPTEPFYLILNTAVGGQWPGYPNATTVFPQYFDVKYVRAYARTLYNPGFENYGPGNNAPLEGWNRFGGTSISTAVRRTDGNAAKIGGTAAIAGSQSGVFQDTPARPGDRWRATAWWMNPASEPMTGSNTATINIEWINSTGGIISVTTSAALDAASPRDTWLPSFADGVAPAGTVKARIVLKYNKPTSASGAAIVDDVDFQPLLINTDFEDRGAAGTTPLAGWTPFGTAAASFNARRSGTYSARLSGQNISGGSTSGVYQDFAVRPGQIWQGSAWWLMPGNDRLLGNNRTQINLEWLDSGKRNIATSTVTALMAGSPADVFTSSATTATAPVGAVWARLALNFTQAGVSAGTAYVDDASLTPLLANSTFEDQGPGENEPLYGWTGFGNRFADARLVRTGTTAAKLFGTFTSATGFSQPSGVMQTFPAVAGQRWRAGAWFAHLADDRLVGGNTAAIRIEWLSSSGNVISGDTIVGLSAASPTGIYAQSVLSAVAPAGTVRARLVLLFTQTGYSAGAALIDDVTLEPISPCGDPIALDAIAAAPATCACSIADIVSGGGLPPGDGIIDGSDFIAFVNAFSSGEPLADLPSADGSQPADGVVDGSDFIAFINAFSTGC